MTDFESLSPVETMQSALEDLERRLEGMPAAQRAPLEADLERLRSRTPRCW